MKEQQNFPCKLISDNCPFSYDKDSGIDVEGMPLIRGDSRSCFVYGHICPIYADKFGLSKNDLNRRASSGHDEKVGSMKKQTYKEKWEDIKNTLLGTICPTCGRNDPLLSLECCKKEVRTKDGEYRSYELTGDGYVTIFCRDCRQSIFMWYGTRAVPTIEKALNIGLRYFEKLPKPSKRSKCFISFTPGDSSLNIDKFNEERCVEYKTLTRIIEKQKK